MKTDYKKEIHKQVRSGELVITTKEIIKEAISEAIGFLYKDDGEFDNNRFKPERTFEQLSKKDIEELAEDVWDYISH